MMVSPPYLRLVPLLALLAALAGCGNESATIRYRATATMVIDGEVREGSAVRETRFTNTPNSLTGFGMAVKDAGEGIVVETGLEDHAIYILLNDRSGSKVMHFVMMQCFGIDSGLPDYDWIGALRDIPTGETCSIGAESIHKLARPLVVAFRRESVPASIFEVTPKSLKGAFNVDGYFRDMSFERVPDNTPLTKAIDQRLPWLNEIPFEGSSFRVLQPYDTTIRRRASDAPLAQRVTDMYFRD
jgi:hypothetical protein